MSEVADCVHCGHPKGTHHAGSESDLACAVKGCECIGYVAKREAGNVQVVIASVATQSSAALADSGLPRRLRRLAMTMEVAE